MTMPKNDLHYESAALKAQQPPYYVAELRVRVRWKCRMFYSRTSAIAFVEHIRINRLGYTIRYSIPGY